MGALHDGHMALVTRAKQLADHVIASIFVNPTQFGANEDLGSYPRTEDADCALLKSHGASAVWIPQAGSIYPEGFSTSISVSGVTEGLCGGKRPGHFDGVALIITKLFNIVAPDYACFGKKIISNSPLSAVYALIWIFPSPLLACPPNVTMMVWRCPRAMRICPQSNAPPP